MSIAAEDVLLPAQAARAAVNAELDAIDAAHARLRALDTDLVGTAFRVEVAERLETHHRVNRGLSYRIFAEIADPTHSLTTETDPDLPPGIRITDLLWQRLRITRGEIRRRFQLAARIRPRRSLTGPTLPPLLPELADAIADGHLGQDHITTITTALDRLPASATTEDTDHAEHLLVANARHHDAPFVAAVGTAIAEAIAQHDNHYTDTDRARRRSLHLGPQQPDGMSRLTGYLDPTTRAYLEPILAAVRPGHHQPTPPEGQPPQPDLRTEGQRNHDALALALRTAIESGNLGTHRGIPVTVIVTTTLNQIDQAIHAATDPTIATPPPARTGGGSRLPMRDLIAMAAGSVHYLAVFDNHTQRPLYLGRSQRIATLDQRLICHARDHGCTRPHCTQPGYHCEVHHSRHWPNGGRTNADELWFVCPHHHTAETRGHYTTTPRNGRLTWTNGTTEPQINHAHHPEELLTDPDPPDGGP